MLYHAIKCLRVIGTHFFSKRYSKGIRFKLASYEPRALILDHTSTSVMHLGDLLFFLDIIWLAHSNGMPVYLVGVSHLKGFFSLFNVQYESNLLNVPPGIVLTKNDSYLFFKKLDHTLIGFNFWQVKGDGPISTILNHHFLEFCKMYFPNLCFEKPRKPFSDFFKELTFKNRSFYNNEKWVVVNSFVNSQRIATFFRQKAFSNFVRLTKKNANHIYVSIGSQKDALAKLNYPIDKDLRGLSSIDDLLHIFINNNIERVITFDTFIAHIAILFNIPTDIFIKSKSKLQITKNRFVPFCESTDQIKPLITYH